MRKIASNYIYLPNYPLIKYGYVEVEGDRIIQVVDLEGTMVEKPCIEFYGGLIVAGGVKLEKKETLILSYLDRLYNQENFECKGLSIIENADLIHMRFLPQTTIRKL